MRNGFLVLLERHLVASFGKRKLNIDLLFVNTGSKILVHGPNRSLTKPEILAEITSDNRLEIVIETASGTSFDHELISKVITDWVSPETVVSLIKK